MKRYFAPTLLTLVTVVLVVPFDSIAEAQTTAARPGDPPAIVEVLGGTATFEAGTNIPAINVHGKSTSLRGRAQVRQAGGAMTIEGMEATLLVQTLTTGLGLRDEHMRKYIFTTGDGEVPDLKFVADRSECAPAAGGASICQVTGQLTIRGTTRPFAIALKVNKAGETYRAAGDGTMRLSTFGIAQPSQFGVTTTDDVKLHLEFAAKPSPSLLAGHTGGGQ